MFKFPWHWCHQCGMVVYCPKCGNSTCNGGQGTVDGTPCETCPAAWAHKKEFAEVTMILSSPVTRDVAEMILERFERVYHGEFANSPPDLKFLSEMADLLSG